MSDFHTTSQGFKIEFLPIPQAIRKFHTTHPEPQPPTYTVTLATGGTEEHPHTEQTIETDDEKAAWQNYLRALSEYNEKFLRICLVKGVRVHAEMDEWLAEQAALEIPVAENPTERKIEWILDRILIDKNDYEAVMMGVMRASGAPEELMTQIESLFRGEMGEPGRDATGEIANPSDGAGVVLQSPDGGGTDGVRDGDTTEPIRSVDTRRQGVRHRRASH